MKLYMIDVRIAGTMYIRADSEAEAQAAFRDAMRGEWETNGPRDDDTDELLPMPNDLDEAHDAIAEAAGADWGRWQITSHVVEPPIYGEGANVYLVRPLVDAWAIYELRVRGDTPEDARQQVKDNRSADKIWNWGEPELSELDHTDYEVWSLDEHGEMADVLIEA